MPIFRSSRISNNSEMVAGGPPSVSRSGATILDPPSSAPSLICLDWIQFRAPRDCEPRQHGSAITLRRTWPCFFSPYPADIPHQATDEPTRPRPNVRQPTTMSRSAVAAWLAELAKASAIAVGRSATGPEQIWTSPGPRLLAAHYIPSTLIPSIPGDSRPRSGRTRPRYTGSQGASSRPDRPSACATSTASSRRWRSWNSKTAATSRSKYLIMQKPQSRTITRIGWLKSNGTRSTSSGC